MPFHRPGRILSAKYPLLLAALGSAGTLACGSGDGGTAPPPPPPVTVAVTPTTAGLVVGETVTIVATVSNSAVPTWNSTAPGVATVSSAGLVTAVTAGSATISATVGSASAAALVTVTAPSIAIGAITQNGQPVNLANLSGVITIEVTANAPANFTGTIEARIDGVVIGSTALTPTPAPATAPAAGPALAPRVRQLEGRTSGTDVVSGEEIARLPNANRTMELALLIPSGAVVATTPPIPVTLNNKNLVVIRGGTYGGNTYVDGQNTSWGGGTLNLRANYINYDGGPSVTFTGLRGSIEAPGGPIQIDVPPLSSLGSYAFYALDATVPPPGGIKGVEGKLSLSDAFLQLLGEPTPTSFEIGNNMPELFNDPPDSYWYPDNAGPTSSVLPVSNSFYVNDKWDVSVSWSLDLGFRYEDDANGPATVTDGGSGFESGGWAARDLLGELILDDVRTGGDLPPTNGFQISLEGVGRDRVGNMMMWPLTTIGGAPARIGTDFIPPMMALNPGGFFLQDNALNPTSGSWLFGLTDPPNSLGGFSGATNDMNFSLTRTLEGLSDDDRCSVGTDENGICTHVKQTIPSGLLSFQSDWELRGKYRAQLQAIDNAGNFSAPLEFWFFSDFLPTVITNPFGPMTIPGGIQMLYGASFADDVDLFSVEGSLKYDEAQFRVGRAPTQIGNPHSSTINRRYEASVPMMTYRSLESVHPFNPFAPTGIIRPLTAYYAGARDVGGNASGTFLDLSGRATPATTSFGATGQDGFGLNLSVTVVCDPSEGHACGSMATSIQAQGQGFIPNNGNTIGITDLLFFAIIPSMDGKKVAVPIGGPAMRTIMDMGSYFEYHWDATLDAADFPPCTEGIAAIGQDETGAGLTTNITPISFQDAPGPVDLSAWRFCGPY